VVDNQDQPANYRANETMAELQDDLMNFAEKTLAGFDDALDRLEPKLHPREVGTVMQVGDGIALLSGLPSVQAEELLRFPGGLMGVAYNLDEEEVGAVLLDSSDDLEAGQEVRRAYRVLDVPVGDRLLGRVLDPLGRPLDNGGPVRTSQRSPVEREAPAIMDRAPVSEPLQTGLKVIDALIPIGRGQRELIVGDRQTGKTAIAVDTILNQLSGDVVCVYCAIGQQSSAVAKVVNKLQERGAMDYTTVIVAVGESVPGLRFMAPYAAMSVAEHFRDQGRDALVILDDLTRHARAYRELSLLLRRPPGREAYPGDIFYVHSRLLERATHLNKEHGGGSLTALPIIETQAQNLSAYIPTNLISITDGQIYLSPDLFHKSLLPAVDVGKSVSRVGGKTQLPAYREVAGDLRLSYSQYNELEVFSRFGTRLDEETRQTLERGRRVREALKQSESSPMAVREQIAVLFSVKEGLFDPIPLEKIPDAQRAVRDAVTRHLAELGDRIEKGEKLNDEDREALRETCRKAISPSQKNEDNAKVEQ